MDYNHDQFAYYSVTIFVSIIGTAASNRCGFRVHRAQCSDLIVRSIPT